jgi:tetratricopeptide (TPR) repeat protein
MSRKKLFIAGGVSAAALLAFSALFTLILGGQSLDTPKKLSFAMSLLDEGRWDVAGRLARDLNDAGSIDQETNSAWHYVQGVSKLQSVVDELDTPKNRKILLEASEHLQKSEELGFPIGFQGKGNFYLGSCLFHTYRWDDAVEHLKDVPVLWPNRRSDAYRMSIDAHLNRKPSNTAAAEETLKRWEAIPGMSSRELAGLKLATAQLAFVNNDLQRCEELLTSIDPELPEYFEALLWRGRWRLKATADKQRPAAELARLGQEASEVLREVIVAADTPNGMRRQAAYLSGLNLRQQGRTREALGTLNGVRQRNPHSAEAIAAGIAEAEILVETGHLEGVVTTIHHLLRNIEDVSLYNGYWVPIDQLRTRLLDIARKLRNQQDYPRVIQLADYLSLAFPMTDTIRLQAETYQQWGDDLANTPLPPTLDAQAERRKQLNRHYHLAAEKFEELARLELRSSDYPEILWSAAESYRQANDLRKANSFLTEYIRFEDRVKRARGFVALGRNYVHAGEWTKALEPLDRCLVEYPTNPVSYEARLLAARAKNELGEMEAAIELLESNLSDFQLDPQSPVWQDSLFELGQTMYQKGDRLSLLVRENPSATVDAGVTEKLQSSHADFLSAIQRLNEAVSRYPEDPRYYDTRYLLAKSYGLAAQLPEHILESNPNLIDTARREQSQLRRRLLEKSLEAYRNLYQTINNEAESGSPAEATLSIVRNCYFGEADVLFELGRFEEAILAYRNAASRFLNQPESLEALVQLAVCHRKLGREFEAKKALAQAEQVLRRIPADYDARFVSSTRANRQEWGELIGWLRTWD